MAKSQSETGKVVMAVVGRPHGVRGEVRVRTFTADPLALGNYGPLSGSNGITYRVDSVRPGKKGVIVRFATIDSREDAERLGGVELSVDREVLPTDALAKGEFYHADLIGLRVVDTAGTDHGQIVAIHDFGGGDLLELSAAGGHSPMIPFTDAAVPVVDLAAGRIVVDPVAAGLADTEDDDAV